jgi:hypothetical protein
VAVAVLAPGLVACGDSSGPLSKTAYETKMRAVGHDFSLPPDGVATTDFKRVPAYFGTVATRLDKLVQYLGAIEPPESARDAHARLVDGYRKEATIVNSLAAETRGASAARVQLLLRQFDSTALRSALRQIQAADDELAARGFRISSSRGG